MNILSFVFLLASLTCGILNPRIGLFSTFIAVQCLIVFCFLVVATVKAKQSISPHERSNVRIRVGNGLNLRIAVIVVAWMLSLISSIVSVIVWMLSSGKFDGIVSSVPFDILGVANDNSACTLLAFLVVTFNIFGTMLITIGQVRARRRERQQI